MSPISGASLTPDMKRIVPRRSAALTLAVILLAAGLISCSQLGIGGDNVGDGVTVSVSFRETKPVTESIPLIERMAHMTPAFEAIIRAIEYENLNGGDGGYRSEDPTFVTAVLSRLALSQKGGTEPFRVSSEELEGYLAACFGERTELPRSLADGLDIDPSSEELASLPERSVELADVTRGSGDAWTAYLNYRDDTDSSIISVYILSVADARDTEWGYSVLACVEYS